MATLGKTNSSTIKGTVDLGFEAKPWAPLDALHPSGNSRRHFKAEYLLNYRSFNDSNWRGEVLSQDDADHAGNATTYARLQHFIHHLARALSA